MKFYRKKRKLVIFWGDFYSSIVSMEEGLNACPVDTMKGGCQLNVQNKDV